MSIMVAQTVLEILVCRQREGRWGGGEPGMGF